jgi:hypothetical protein
MGRFTSVQKGENLLVFKDSKFHGAIVMKIYIELEICSTNSPVILISSCLHVGTKLVRPPTLYVQRTCCG